MSHVINAHTAQPAQCVMENHHASTLMDRVSFPLTGLALTVLLSDVPAIVLG